MAPRYIKADSPVLLAEPYPLSLERLNAALLNGDTELAHLVFYLSRRRFTDKTVFWRLGIRACLAERDLDGAMDAALHCIRLSPMPESYEALFDVQLAAERHEKAEHTAVFLARVAEEGSPTRERARAWLLARGLRPDSAHLWPE